MYIDIIPLQHVLFDSISLRFGQSRGEVEALMGPGEAVGHRYYYFDSQLALDYDAQDRLEFVEFLAGAEGTLRPRIGGVSVFDHDADALTDLLAQQNGGPADDPETGHCLTFHRLSIGLYRDITPADVAEMIAEMQADGLPTDHNPDLDADIRRARQWSTVGAGRSGYYR